MAKPPANDPLSQEIGRLKQTVSGRRGLSWLLFLTCIGICLVLPYFASTEPAWLRQVLAPLDIVEKKPLPPVEVQLSQHQNQNAGQAVQVQHAPPSAFKLDQLWDVGPMSSAHQPWANNCKVCHSEPFTMVQDRDCKVCHSTVPDHVNKSATQVAALDTTRCAECHREHKGPLALAEQNTHYSGQACAACHGDLQTVSRGSKVRNVTDFADDHPEFRVQVATGPKPTELKRIVLTAGQDVVEKNNLKFPHGIHLASQGIKGPSGKVVMACRDCHSPDGTGVSFLPVNMKEHCQSCHELRFEPSVSNRQVPHGSVEEVLNTLREFYAFAGSARSTAAPPASNAIRARPGQASDRAEDSPLPLPTAGSGGIRDRAAHATRELFEKTTCLTCHTITKVAGPGRAGTSGRDLPQYAVAPIRPQHIWMPKAKFNHAAHRGAACGDCHSAKMSDSSADVLMPSIEICRDCHVGKQPVVNKVTSDCGLCHGFHQPEHEAPAPGHIPAQQAKRLKTAAP